MVVHFFHCPDARFFRHVSNVWLYVMQHVDVMPTDVCRRVEHDFFMHEALHFGVPVDEITAAISLRRNNMKQVDILTTYCITD